MALLTYLDCSGDAIDPRTRVISVGGFIAHEDQWVELERRWAPVLEKHGVTALHMRDFAHSTEGSEFEAWKGKEEKRRDFLGSLIDIINDCTIQSVGATLLVDAYRAVDHRYTIREAIGAPYTIAALLAVSMTTGWHERHKRNEELMFIFEKGDNEQADFKDVLKRLPAWDLDLIVEPIFREKKWKDREGRMRHFVPFQAADLICYEEAKAITDLLRKGKRHLRRSFHRLSWPPRDDHMWRPMVERDLLTLAKRFGVLHRYNHDVSPTPAEMPLEPLCFSHMETPLVSYSGGPPPVGDSNVVGPLPGALIRTRFVARIV